jgi:virginiamycin B lyase
MFSPLYSGGVGKFAGIRRESMRALMNAMFLVILSVLMAGCDWSDTLSVSSRGGDSAPNPQLQTSAHKINEYLLKVSRCGPAGITTGPDNALWFTEFWADNIGRIDPSSHTVTEYPTNASYSRPAGITIGPDNALWFTEFNVDSIGRIDPQTHVITEYPVLTSGSSPLCIATGPDNALWFTEPQASQIGRIDPTSHVVTEYPVLTSGSSPAGITLGPDNALWFTEAQASQIGRIDPTTHVVTEYPTLTSNSGPAGITKGPDGAVWFTEIGYYLVEPYLSDVDTFKVSKIGRIDPTTHTVTEYAVPTSESTPGCILIGPDGALWFTEPRADKIGRIDPQTHAVTQYPVPTAKSLPGDVTVGPDSALWFTEGQGNKIGQLAIVSPLSAPSNVKTAATGVGQVTVSFTDPASNGGSSITGYTVAAAPGNVTAIGMGTTVGTTTSLVVSGLNNGADYTFTVTATNAKGLTATSKASKEVTTWAAPSQPKITVLKAGNAQVIVTFSLSKTNPGDPVSYAVTATATGQTTRTASGSKSPLTVTGLTNGVSYTFTVKATNQVGSSTSPSKSIAPKAPSK